MKKLQDIPQLRFDTERMKQDISIQDALQTMLGVNVPRNGMIHCIDQNHNDTHASCSCKNGICHCFSCGGTWDVFGVAELVHPEMNFPERCQYLCDTFGLNQYIYSNLGDVEAAMQAKTEKRFHDYLPVMGDDLDFIGLHDPEHGRVEITYAVTAKDYFMHYYGEIPPNAEIYDKDGKLALMDISRREASEMGMIQYLTDENGKEVEHEYIKSPRIVDLWKEDKESTEAMILGKAKDKIEIINSQISDLTVAIDYYRDTHTVEQIKLADKIRSSYINAAMQGRTIILSPAQKDGVEMLRLYEGWKDLRNELTQDLARAEAICDRITNHQKEREQAQKLEQQKNKWKDSR